MDRNTFPRLCEVEPAEPLPADELAILRAINELRREQLKRGDVQRKLAECWERPGRKEVRR